MSLRRLFFPNTLKTEPVVCSVVTKFASFTGLSFVSCTNEGKTCLVDAHGRGQFSHVFRFEGNDLAERYILRPIREKLGSLADWMGVEYSYPILSGTLLYIRSAPQSSLRSVQPAILDLKTRELELLQVPPPSREIAAAPLRSLFLGLGRTCGGSVMLAGNGLFRKSRGATPWIPIIYTGVGGVFSLCENPPEISSRPNIDSIDVSEFGDLLVSRNDPGGHSIRTFVSKIEGPGRVELRQTGEFETTDTAHIVARAGSCLAGAIGSAGVLIDVRNPERSCCVEKGDDLLRTIRFDAVSQTGDLAIGCHRHLLPERNEWFAIRRSGDDWTFVAVKLHGWNLKQVWSIADSGRCVATASPRLDPPPRLEADAPDLDKVVVFDLPR